MYNLFLSGCAWIREKFKEFQYKRESPTFSFRVKGASFPELLSGLPLSRQKKSRTFPDEITDKISNKCTVINTKPACYEVSVAFQQLTNVNSKR